MPHPRYSPCCSQIIIFQVGAKLVIGQKFGNFHTGMDQMPGEIGDCNFSINVIKKLLPEIDFLH